MSMLVYLGVGSDESELNEALLLVSGWEAVDSSKTAKDGSNMLADVP